MLKIKNNLKWSVIKNSESKQRQQVKRDESKSKAQVEEITQ